MLLRRFWASCKHNRVLGSSLPRRICVAQCLGAISGSPTPYSLRPILLAYLHDLDYSDLATGYVIPEVEFNMSKVGASCLRVCLWSLIRLCQCGREIISASELRLVCGMQAGVVLQPSEGPPLLASLHTLHAAVTYEQEVVLEITRAHVGDATKHLEPGDRAMVASPCSPDLTASLRDQAIWAESVEVSQGCAPALLLCQLWAGIDCLVCLYRHRRLLPQNSWMSH